MAKELQLPSRLLLQLIPRRRSHNRAVLRCHLLLNLTLRKKSQLQALYLYPCPRLLRLHQQNTGILGTSHNLIPLLRFLPKASRRINWKLTSERKSSRWSSILENQRSLMF
ncbi:hypothetical protein KC19_N023100 [Ceratodon purpureus]|nr:hypothetical protein KC19_N023100 [Ceratodon purpureus]